MENRRIPSGLAALVAASLLAAATAPRSTGETQDLKRVGADRDDAAPGLIGILLSEVCNCPECQSRRVPPAVAAEADAQGAQQDSNSTAVEASPFAKTLALLEEAEKELHRPRPTAFDGQVRTFSLRAATDSLSSAISALKAYEAFA